MAAEMMGVDGVVVDLEEGVVTGVEDEDSQAGV